MSIGISIKTILSKKNTQIMFDTFFFINCLLDVQQENGICEKFVYDT